MPTCTGEVSLRSNDGRNCLVRTVPTVTYDPDLRCEPQTERCCPQAAQWKPISISLASLAFFRHERSKPSAACSLLASTERESLDRVYIWVPCFTRRPLISSANGSLRGCVNPSSWLPLTADVAFIFQINMHLRVHWTCLCFISLKFTS